MVLNGWFTWIVRKLKLVVAVVICQLYAAKGLSEIKIGKYAA